jgi:hypothetical protein
MTDKEDEAPVQPDRTGMTYYRNDACTAKDAHAPDCICWTPAHPAPTVQEPSEMDLQKCWVEKSDGTIDGIASMRLAIRKYSTTPPAAQPAVPLTDDARGLLVIEHLGPNALLHKPMSIYDAFHMGIDAAEAAHGITKGQP